VEENLSSNSARIIRTIIAIVVLLVFITAIATSFWPAIMPKLFSGVQSARSVGAETFESQYFDIQNSSDASASQVRGEIKILESDYLAITKFLGHEPEDHIPILITNGSGMAIADANQINIFYDNGVLDTSSIPFFLVFFIEGGHFSMDINFFLEAGYAVYVSEEVGRSEMFIGQPVDAWVILLRQNNALLPLSEAWEMGIPENEDDVYDFLRALVMGGSFTRWMVELHGRETITELRAGLDLEHIIGLSITQAEVEWLSALKAKNVSTRSCNLAAPPSSILLYFCDYLNETTP
jgi:hypothetical protein